jgi:hypothetical protein
MIGFVTLITIIASIGLLVGLIGMAYYLLVGIGEIIDRIKEKYFPQYYYYDWDEEDEI